MTGKTDTSTGLQEAQQRFADEYLIDFNATAAYQRAGYKARGQAAHVAASKLLANEKVQAYLAAKRQALLKRTETSQEETLRRLAILALGDRRALYRADGTLKAMHELTADEAAMIQGLEVVEMFAGKGEERKAVGYTTKVKLVNSLDAVKTLGQHYGLFTQKHEHIHRAPGLAGILEEIDGAGTGPGPAQPRGA